MLAAQADDLFALYQHAQLLAAATELDDLVHVTLPQLVRVADSPYAALFLPLGAEQRLDLIGWIGPDLEEEAAKTGEAPSFGDGDVAAEWFYRASGVNAQACLCLALDVGRALPGLLALAAPSQEGFDRHRQHLLATMARETERAMHLALARSDLQERHRAVQQMQADFVATVSHELRAPLARIQGYVDSLTHLALTADQQRRFIGDIGHATAQLTRLVETILSFSQVEEGPLTPVARPTDVAAVVGRAVDDLAPADRSRLQLDVPPIAVLADPQRLGQVMDNLIANALKYSPADAAVQVRAQARPAAGTAWLSVRDRGQGVPPDDRPYLFSKFFRARTVRESSVPGTGLGLYLCKRLIEAQGGTIRLRSRTGSGTIVRILLPLA